MSTGQKKVRTRFAPSPTGYLHVGGARTALFNYLYARARGGEFILRIEDTDQERSTEESYEQMLESVRWLNLEWDEGPLVGGNKAPYRQSERLDIYRRKVSELEQRGQIYRCFCTSEELEGKKRQREAMGLPPVYDMHCRNLSPEEIQQRLDRQIPFAWRFKMPNDEIVVRDLVQGEVRFNTSLIGDFIILKSDGFPSYNFAVVVDDHLMEISHVIRGVGHLSNTPRQIAIYRAFGWAEPVWAHVSEIVGSDHKKLSKRHGATAITAFRDMGYPSAAFVNYMALLGWSPPDGQEYMTIDKIISQFDIARCSKSPAMFDVFDLELAGEVELSKLSPAELQQVMFPKSKLNWISNQRIRETADEDYIQAIFPFVEKYGQVPASELSIDNQNLRQILLSLRVYLDNYFQIGRYIGDFYGSVELSSEAAEWLQKPFARALVEVFISELEKNSDWNEASINASIKNAGKLAELKGKDLFMTLRAAATGKVIGLEMPVYLALLGREKVMSRLKTNLAHTI